MTLVLVKKCEQLEQKKLPKCEFKFTYIKFSSYAKLQLYFGKFLTPKCFQMLAHVQDGSIMANRCQLRQSFISMTSIAARQKPNPRN